MSSPRTRRAAIGSSKFVLYAAIAGNLLVAGTKFLAAALSGSSAMSSEAVHSLVDTGNSVLMLYGLHRAAAPPDREHPLGHGREIYFWSFVVAVLVFALGAGISLLQGIAHIATPVRLENKDINYIVLGLSGLIDGATWFIALRSLKTQVGDVNLFAAIRSSKDPPSFMVLFEDSAALLGLAIAFLGAYFSDRLNLPVLDGVASILISLLLATTATLLARETKGLLIGEGADPQIVASILRIATEMEGVDHANGVITVHLSPNQIAVALSLEFADEMRTPEIEAKVDELERRVRLMCPNVIALFVKPQSSLGYRTAILRRSGPSPFVASLDATRETTR